MRSVSATEAKQRLAALLDAAQREPVMIRRQNRDVAVLLSPQEYDRLRAPNTDEFQRFCDRIGERAAARRMTEERERVVIDTNALISRLLSRGRFRDRSFASLLPTASCSPPTPPLWELGDGAAQLIITGDADLLALHPFRGIDILTPASYLAR